VNLKEADLGKKSILDKKGSALGRPRTHIKNSRKCFQAKHEWVKEEVSMLKLYQRGKPRPEESSVVQGRKSKKKAKKNPNLVKKKSQKKPAKGNFNMGQYRPTGLAL